MSDEFLGVDYHPQNIFRYGLIYYDPNLNLCYRQDWPNGWHMAVPGGDVNAHLSIEPIDYSAPGSDLPIPGVQLVMDNNGGNGGWVGVPWIKQDIASVPVSSDTVVTWTQFDKEHSLIFGVDVQGVDGTTRRLMYAYNADNHWGETGFADMSDTPGWNGWVFNQWLTITRNIAHDYQAEFGVGASQVLDVAVGHFNRDDWIGDHGGTVGGIYIGEAQVPTPTPTPYFQPWDNFSDVLDIPLLPYGIGGPLDLYTTESGEPVNPNGCFPAPIGHTAWSKYTASESGKITAETHQSNFDTELAVYTGQTPDTLNVIACNDDATGHGMTSEVSFDAAQGETYYFQVGGYGDAFGQFQLNISQEGPVLTSTATFTPSGPPTSTPTPVIPTNTRTPTAPVGATSTRTFTPLPSTPTNTPLPTNPPGDCNGDHIANSIDAALILQFAAGLNVSVINSCDVNRDGYFNAIDAALILQYVAGLIGSL